MTNIIAVRGATTLESDSKEEVICKTTELIKELSERNNINNEHNRCVSVIISSTKDIRSFYPARAIREGKLINAPLFSCMEPDIEGSLPLCIRVMLTLCGSSETEARHVYLHKAATLRPDLSE